MTNSSVVRPENSIDGGWWRQMGASRGTRSSVGGRNRCWRSEKGLDLALIAQPTGGQRPGAGTSQLKNVTPLDECSGGASRPGGEWRPPDRAPAVPYRAVRASYRQAPCGFLTRGTTIRQNAHNTEVAVRYPWHAWYGTSV
jgi:hypothetical protein